MARRETRPRRSLQAVTPIESPWQQERVRAEQRAVKRDAVILTAARAFRERGVSRGEGIAAGESGQLHGYNPSAKEPQMSNIEIRPLRPPEACNRPHLLRLPQ